jgi:hypothetical protein
MKRKSVIPAQLIKRGTSTLDENERFASELQLQLEIIVDLRVVFNKYIQQIINLETKFDEEMTLNFKKKTN